MAAFTSALLLALFFAIDSFYFRRDRAFREASGGGGPVRLSVDGLRNLVFLAGILAAVLVSGLWKANHIEILGIEVPYQNILRDSLLIAMGLLSLALTPKRVRAANEFSWFPMKEVAILFAGIFVTIIPALAILKAGERGALASLIVWAREPAHYFWATGALSSFLDNAPTYLSFFSTALGRFGAGLPEIEAVHGLLREQAPYLIAISAGAVFMGANSYVGNAPNFMVRSIAEEAGVPMPSFFGYMLRYSIPILIPVFLLATLVFL
jgi:Na+/H+ antiporter NhaD/arsenite permease-like protein